MPRLRFQPVFFFLMSLAAASAFLIPPQYTAKVTPRLEWLFAPVARPSGAVGAWANGRSAGLPPDDRAGFVIKVENDELRQQNIYLRQRVEDLERLNADRAQLGDLRTFCTPVPVIGGDPGIRESLAVEASSLGGLRDGMYVIYPGGIVGTLRSGLAGGQVELITNPGKRVYAYFSGQRGGTAKGQDGRPANTAGYVRLNKERVLVEGAGKGQLVYRLGRVDDVKAWGLQKGDWVVLDDDDWPARLHGVRIGWVNEIVRHKDNPLFCEVRITPAADLRKLREVMVLTRQ
jgi:cell shape-determining protein MreC